MAAVFFSVSLSPSLLPRPFLLQGLLSGFTMFIAYGIGVGLERLYFFLELPKIEGRARTVINYSALIICSLLVISALFYVESWQNGLREQMGLAPNDTANEIFIALISMTLACFVLLFVRTVIFCTSMIAKPLMGIIPKRVAILLGACSVMLSLAFLTNDFIVSSIVNKFDKLYAYSDASTDTGVAQPQRPHASGSDVSLIPWSSLGRNGQNFVSKGPTKTTLSKYFNSQVKDPLRIYAGYRSAPTFEQRAQLALEELIRVGGFNRSVLIIATPTGTGWHDPSAVDSLEYLHRGDTAIVTMQYSYLPSWLTLLLDANKAKKSAAVLYRVIHKHWRTLPESTRPRLYLHGLSLGAYGAETSIEIPSLIKDPLHGGVFAGVPFPASIGPQLTRNRQPDSPQWLPIIQDSSLVRFTTQDNALNIKGAEWGPMRFVYIQYASDPMVYMSTDLYWREPDWLKGKRAHDVSTELTWYPIVTFLQLLFDLPMADHIPRGNGHSYAAKNYIDAWLEVTDAKGWNSDAIIDLKHHFSGK